MRVLPYVPMAAALAVIAQLRSPANDYFQFWYAGHLVATGRSPYDPAAWGVASQVYGDKAGIVALSCALPDSPACLWAYPPWVGWLFAPFGSLDPDHGIALQAAFLLVVGIAGVVLLAHAVPLSPAAAMVVRFVAVAAAPFVWASFLGQFDGLLLLGALLVMLGLRDRRAIPLAAGALVLSLKPNLFIALVPLTVVLLVARRSWRSLAVTSVALSVVTAAAIVLDPVWLGSLARATTKVALTAATTWSLGQSATPGVAPLTIALVLLLSTAAAWSSIRGAPPRLWDATVVASGIALSLVVTPYAHLYDYLLLAPAIAVAIAAVEHHGSAARSLALLAYGGGFFVLTWIAFLVGPHGDESPVNALIPPAVLAGLVLALRWRAGAGGARSQPLPR